MHITNLYMNVYHEIFYLFLPDTLIDNTSVKTEAYLMKKYRLWQIVGNKLNVMEQYFHVCLQILLDTSDVHIRYFLKNNLMQLKGSRMLEKATDLKKKPKKTLET